MQFNEKLIYLMNITNTSNKMLASAINVDPSMISLIRTGRRGQPRNEEHLRAMAVYFAGKCTSPYQKEAVSEIVGAADASENPYAPLADYLFEWLSGKLYALPGNMHHVLQEFNKPIPETPVRQTVKFSSDHAPAVFYGNAGKREALRMVYQALLNLEEPCTIYAYADETSTWTQDEPQLWRDIRNWKMTLLDRGFKICHILPPASSPQFYDTIVHWIPLYLTGQVEAYYYPRLRDSLFRRSLLLSEGHVGICCDSIASEYETQVSTLSYNAAYIAAHVRMFKDLVYNCQRTMVAHTQPYDIIDCLIRYMDIPTDFIQCSQELPLHLLPAQYHMQALSGSSEDFQKYFYEKFVPASREHRELLRSHQITNLVPLYTVDDILSGEIGYMFPGHTQRYIYTPVIYRDHLLNVIRYMEENPNYNLIPVAPQDVTVNIMIKRDRSALVIRQTDPIAIFEIEQPDIIAPFYEFVVGKMNRHARTAYSRRKLITYMKEIADEFTHYIEKQSSCKSCCTRKV